MKLHVDLETFELIEGPGFRNPVNSLRFKRGDAAKLEVVFLRNGTTPEAIGNPAQLELRFGVKPRNRYDVGYLVHTSSWTLPAPGAESPTYQCSPSFNTEELNSALNLGSATASELSEITLMGEITWRQGIAEPTSTRTFLVVVENDVNRGDEGLPESAEPAYPAPSSIELVTRKGMPHGYAELDSSGAVPVSQLPQSVELTSHKGQPHGYAELDENGLVPAFRLPSIQGMHGIQITEHGVAVGMSSYAFGTATVVGTLASGSGVSIGYAAASHGEAVALGNYAMAYNHGIALGMGARTEGNKCIAIGNGAITGDVLHGYGRLEIAPYGSTGPRLSGHIWGGANVMQFSVTDGHGFSPSALHGGAVFNHAPGTIPSGMMMFAYSALNGSLTIYVNSAGTLKTATIAMT